MPKYAVLSDIHANADALTVVLEKCRELAVDKYVSLGDIVGYNAEPERCMKMVRELNVCAKVRGNHDDYVSSGNTGMAGINVNARKAIEWTRGQLDASMRSELAAFPFKTMVPACGATLVHATLDTPENWKVRKSYSSPSLSIAMVFIIPFAMSIACSRLITRSSPSSVASSADRSRIL